MRIAIYSRKSKFTGKGESIENQIEMCKEYIKNFFPDEDIEYSVFEDEGFSGKSLNRPHFQKMMKEERVNPFKYIVVYRLDRISRNVGDFANLIEQLNEYHTSFICIKEQFDTSTPMGRAMMNIAAVFAQLERETIAERIRDNMNLLARTGRWLGGNSPLGYKSQQVSNGNKTFFKLVVNNDGSSDKVKIIFNKYLELHSMTATLSYLENNGIRTVNECEFTTFSLREILDNPVYCEVTQESYDYFNDLGCQMCFNMDEVDGNYGFAVYNRKAATSTKTVSNNPDKWIVALGKHPPLVNAADWLKTQKLREISKGISFHRKVHNKNSLLSGLVYCGECGHKMRPRINSRPKIDGTRSFSYMCEYKEKTKRQQCKNKNIDGNILDKIICEELFKFDKTGSNIQKQINQIEKNILEKSNIGESEISFIDKQIINLQCQIKNLINNLTKTSEEDALYNYIKVQVDEIDKKIKELKIQKQKFTNQSYSSEHYKQQYDFIIETLSIFKSSFETIPIVKKRELIRNVVEKVVWDGDSVHIFIYGATR